MPTNVYRREIVNNVINGSAYKNKPSSSGVVFASVGRMFACARAHSQRQSEGYECVCVCARVYLTCFSYIVSGFVSVYLCVCVRVQCDEVTLH